MTNQLRRQLSRIGTGDHLCLIYEDPAEALPAAAYFLKEGLDRGEHALYVVDDHGLEEVCDAFTRAGLDVQAALEDGTLRFLSAREYCPLDEFEPGRMLDRFRELGDEMAREGIPAARAAVEMTWALTVGAPLDLLAEYECLGNNIFEHFTGSSLCMYNRRRFPADAMERLLRAHPIVVLGGEVAPNPFYEPPEVYFAQKGEEARRLEWMLERLRLERADRRARDELVASERDARARARAAARSEFLAEAGRLLNASLDIEDTLRAAARLGAGGLGDLGVVELSGDDDPRIAAVHLDPEMQDRLDELIRSLDDTAARERLGTIRNGKPLLLNDLEDSGGRSANGEGVGPALARKLDASALIAVPLVSREGMIGALTVAATDPARRFGTEELAFAQELAGLAALAIENGRLYRAALRAREEAQEANRAKMNFLSAMSHELRTPLNAMAGYVELIDGGFAGTVSDGQREMLSRVKRSQAHLIGLVDDVLHFAKLEVGHLEYRIEDVVLQDLLQNVVEMLAAQAKAKELRLELRELERGVVARCDRERARQIALNLVGNAIKFTPPGGRVALCCGTEDGRVVLRVEDTGPGISPEQLETVFEAFVQFGQEPDESKRRGVGLGLAISRELARGMDGELSAESELGVGSTFVLRLPLGAGRKTPSRTAGRSETAETARAEKS